MSLPPTRLWVCLMSSHVLLGSSQVVFSILCIMHSSFALRGSGTWGVACALPGALRGAAGAGGAARDQQERRPGRFGCDTRPAGHFRSVVRARSS